MTPPEIAEWIGLAVAAALSLALILSVLGGVAAVAVWAWDEWRKNR